MVKEAAIGRGIGGPCGWTRLWAVLVGSSLQSLVIKIWVLIPAGVGVSLSPAFQYLASALIFQLKCF